MPSITPPLSDSMNHLQNYLANQLACYIDALTLIQSDVRLLIQATSGLVALTPEIQSCLLAISDDIVPKSWLPSCIPSFHGVQKWLMSMKQRMAALHELYEEDDATKLYCFNLAVFWNPKLFVKCLLQEHARKEYIEVYKLSLQTQVNRKCSIN